MKYKRILVVTDNYYLFTNFVKLIERLKLSRNAFTFTCTSKAGEKANENLLKIDVKKDYKKLINEYDLIISLHCKQIFPKELVTSVRCINIHPGFNPYNRGWYPQVFSIINKLPAGATIHEMDEYIDHGKILAQKKVAINNWDTSLDVYNKVINAEFELLEENIVQVLNNKIAGIESIEEGNYNSLSDFKDLLEIDLNETLTAQTFIDRLRALTHGDFNNAYFVDPATGKKVYVKLHLQVE
jgi:methionyl-tRNA formyltransferase